MSYLTQFKSLAEYNKRMNRQLITVVEQQCSSEQLSADKGAYFGSIIGTFNHILVGDLIWLSRFAAYSERYQSLELLRDLPKPKGLDHCLYNDFPEFCTVRYQVDERIIAWIESEVTEKDCEGVLRYFNTKGIKSERSFCGLVLHLFNHQTHHRGQLSTLLNQLNIDIGATDLLGEIPDLA